MEYCGWIKTYRRKIKKAVETYCFSCKKNTGNRNSTVKRTTKKRLILYQIVLYEVRKKQDLLKIHESSRQLF